MSKPALATFTNRGAESLALAVVLMLLLLSGCAKPGTRLQAGPRDYLVGCYMVTTQDRIIPVFKQGGTYYSVCRGFEVPLKECAEGLEWAITPSSMTGTKIGWDAGSRTYYLAVMDAQASNNTDGRYGVGKRELMTRMDKPLVLRDAKARRPYTHDAVLGWYHPVWFPPVRIEIRKDGDRYFSQEQEFGGPTPGSWTTRVEPCELRPLPDQAGFTGSDRKNRHRLVYHDTFSRFELVKPIEGMNSFVLRMPLARIPAPASTDGGPAPSPMMPIGIPSWH